MTPIKLLSIEVLFHAQLALLLLTMPRLLIQLLGWPPAPSTFWPRLLGGLLAAIALATLTSVMGWTKEGTGAGIGLAAEIVINLTMAFVLFSMLFLGPEMPTARGKLFAAVLASFLLLLALVEIAYV